MIAAGGRGRRATAEPGVEVAAIGTPTLGDRSYLAHDGQVALVIDPQRDIDRVLALAAARGVRVTHVFETHLHNDYVTGGLALARATGAAYHVNAADTVAFDRVPVRDWDVIDVGPVMRIRVIATPGHTFTHLSYVVETPRRPPAVFTGGSLLYGTTGRPDLLGAAHSAELAHDQYASARRLAAALPQDAEVYPTHGFGSFCAAAPSEGTSSTIGQERRVNPALTLDEQRFVSELLAGLDAYPAYYARLGAVNAAGPAGPDLSRPHAADAGRLRRRIQAGEWVVDVRARRVFAAGHLAGTLGFDLDGSFATHAGWLIPWGTPVTLLGQTPDQVAEAQRELVRIGIDRPAATAVGDPAGWSGGRPLRSFPVADFSDLEAVRPHRPVVILDVRRDQEWAESHIDGATHMPLHELPGRLAEVPEGELWVHCQTGYRASVAASILDAAGRTVVAIDDEYHRAGAAGLPIAFGDICMTSAAGAADAAAR
jgi:glyoxylase-like metal-dependent hydrolase (beta-lactamase superfamily II)/rhodanese-related sulfurtransferase